jgi:hypothetical protein
VVLSYLPSLASTFDFVAVPLPLLLAAIFIVLLYVIATEVMKLWFYRLP